MQDQCDDEYNFKLEDTDLSKTSNEFVMEMKDDSDEGV